MEKKSLGVVTLNYHGEPTEATIYENGICKTTEGKMFRLTKEQFESYLKMQSEANKNNELAKKAVEVSRSQQKETVAKEKAQTPSQGLSLKSSIVHDRAKKKVEQENTVQEEDEPESVDFSTPVTPVSQDFTKEPDTQEQENIPIETSSRTNTKLKINPLIPLKPKQTDYAEAQKDIADNELSSIDVMNKIIQKQPIQNNSYGNQPYNDEPDELQTKEIEAIRRTAQVKQKKTKENKPKKEQSGYNKIAESGPQYSSYRDKDEDIEEIQILDIIPTANTMNIYNSGMTPFVPGNKTQHQAAVLPINSFEACIYLSSSYNRLKHKGSFAYYFIPRDGEKRRVLSESGLTDNEFEYAIYGAILAFKDVLRNKVRQVVVVTKDDLTRDVLMSNAMNVKDSWDETRAEYVNLMRKHAGSTFAVQFATESKRNGTENFYMDIVKRLADNML